MILLAVFLMEFFSCDWFYSSLELIFLNALFWSFTFWKMNNLVLFSEVTWLYFYAIYFSHTNVCETSRKKLWTELKCQLKTRIKFFFLVANSLSTVICFNFDRILQMLSTLLKCTGKKRMQVMLPVLQLDLILLYSYSLVKIRATYS